MISVEIYDAWKTRMVETQAQIRHPACQIVGLWDATLDATVIILQNLYFSLFILRRLGAKNLSLLVWHLWAESGNCKAWNWSKDQWSHTVHKPKGKSVNKAVRRLITINPVKIKQFNGLFAFFYFRMISFFQGGNGLLLFWAKYLMFPLFELAHKQMRQEQFIVLTITFWHFPTVWPGFW